MCIQLPSPHLVAVVRSLADGDREGQVVADLHQSLINTQPRSGRSSAVWGGGSEIKSVAREKERETDD